MSTRENIRLIARAPFRTDVKYRAVLVLVIVWFARMYGKKIHEL